GIGCGATATCGAGRGAMARMAGAGCGAGRAAGAARGGGPPPPFLNGCACTPAAAAQDTTSNIAAARTPRFHMADSLTRSTNARMELSFVASQPQGRSYDLTRRIFSMSRPNGAGNIDKTQYT